MYSLRNMVVCLGFLLIISQVISSAETLGTGEPYTVSNVDLVAFANKVNVSWELPKSRTGPTTYIIDVTDLTFSRHFNKKVKGLNSTYVLLTEGIKPYRNYSVMVSTETEHGVVTSDPVVTQTMKDAPGTVSQASFEMVKGKCAEMRVEWTAVPKEEWNDGEINYHVQVTGGGSNLSLDITGGEVSSFQKVIEVDLETNYTVLKVTAYNTVGEGLPVSSRTSIFTGCCISPYPPGESSCKTTTVIEGAGEMKESVISVKLRKDFFTDETTGKITYRGLAVCQEGNCERHKKGYQYNGLSIEKYKRDHDAVWWKYFTKVPGVEYYRIKLSEKELEPAPHDGEHFLYVIGGDKTCDIVRGEENDECNGPLKSNTKYRVKAVKCTAIYCLTTHVSEPLIIMPDNPEKTEPPLAPEALAAIYFAGTFTVIMMIFACLFFCGLICEETKDVPSQENEVFEDQDLGYVPEVPPRRNQVFREDGLSDEENGYFIPLPDDYEELQIGGDYGYLTILPSEPEVEPKKKTIFDLSIKRKVLKQLPANMREDVQQFVMDVDGLECVRSLGKGFFGAVYLCKLFRNNESSLVAVKSLKGGGFSKPAELKAFLEEALKIKDVRNDHILSPLGIVFHQGNPKIVLPYMENGDLKSLLSKRISSNEPFDLVTLVGFCRDVAAGMSYLSRQKLAHMDLAARNCMVDGELRVKVGDFGMTHDLYEKSYYRLKGGKPVPIRWMAPESIMSNKYTCKSDVWSYGVVMWEIFTHGDMPYKHLVKKEFLKSLASRNFICLECPKLCPPKIYSLMCECWSRDPDARPWFSRMKIELESFIRSQTHTVQKEEEVAKM